MTWSGLRFPFTAAALAVAWVILGAAWVGHITMIAVPAGLIGRIEFGHIGPIVAVLLGVGMAFLIDQVLVTRRINMLAKGDAERLQVVQRTIGTVQGIVNTCRLHLQLLRADAEGHVPPESLALFDEAVLETVRRLRDLGDLEASVPAPVLVGPGADTPHGAATTASSSADRSIARVVAGTVLTGIVVGLTVVRPKSLTTVDDTGNAGAKGITTGIATTLRDGGSADAVNGDGPLATTLVDDRAVNVVTELVVATQPAGGRVTVDGIGWGVAPVTIRYLSPGDKRIRVTKDGFATTERIVQVTEGNRQITNIRLRQGR
jgi:hypothetical protein